MGVLHCRERQLLPMYSTTPPRGRVRGSGIPAVLVADLDHGGEDVVPGFGLHHDVVGEHAAVPADVLDGTGGLALLVLEPVAGDLGDVELAGGVVGEAVAAGLVVGATAVDGGVVLGDVE